VATPCDGGISTWCSEALFPSSTRFSCLHNPEVAGEAKGGAPCQPAHGETEQLRILAQRVYRFHRRRRSVVGQSDFHSLRRKTSATPTMPEPKRNMLLGSGVLPLLPTILNDSEGIDPSFVGRPAMAVILIPIYWDAVRNPKCVV